MEKLKIIADWRFGNQLDNTRNYEDIPVNERDNNSWWYLHGQLESLVHYDKGTVTNCQSGGFGKETINYSWISGDKVKEIHEDSLLINKMCFDGIVDVEIEGIDKECIGYFWTNDYKTVYYNDVAYEIWDQRGLVCLKTDFDGCEYAYTKYLEKSSFL